MNIIDKNIDDLIPYTRNQKKHTEEQVIKIASSIKEFGFKQPIVIDENNEIIIGHGRVLAAKKLNLEHVPCLIANDLNKSQIKALRIADNKLNESDWDYEFLELEMEELKTEGFDIEITGIDLTDYSEEENINDLSDKNISKFEIIITCKNENDVEKKYNQLIEEGYECKISIL